MLEDRQLVNEIKHNRRDGLRQIYDRYRADMLGRAMAMAGDGRKDKAVRLWAAFSF